MSRSAEIVEIFSSIQGEGIYAGTPMTFVRFERCTMKCKYCDTPEGLCHHETCRVENPPRSGEFVEVSNPLSASALCEALGSFDDQTLSITGGEPLEQSAFLAEWLPSQIHTHSIFLETNGVHYKELERVAPCVHAISMDLKLPSSTGCKARWKEHEAFLRTAIALGKEIHTKVVVTSRTTDHDIEKAIKTVIKVNKHIPVVIQPASQTLTFHEIVSPRRLKSIERLCQAYLPNVNTQGQMHKVWELL